MTRSRISGLLIATAALIPCPLVASRGLAGTIYDAAADFSPTNNPNGVLSYGVSTTLGGPLTLYPYHVSDWGGIDFWESGPGSGGIPPWVGHNGTPNPITFGSVTFEPGQLGFHPGSNDE